MFLFLFFPPPTLYFPFRCPFSVIFSFNFSFVFSLRSSIKNYSKWCESYEKYTKIVHNYNTNYLKSTKNGAREGPGEVPGDHGWSSGSPGVSRGRPGEPFGLWRAPLWSRFGSILGAFSDTFSSEFRVGFFEDFGTHSGSIWAPFWEPKSTSEPLRHEKVDLQKPSFSSSKTILFKLRGCLEAPKIDIKTGFETQCVFLLISVWKNKRK